MYVTLDAVKSSLDPELLEGKPDTILTLLIKAAGEAIDGYCRSSFPAGKVPFSAGDVPALVQTVAIDLVGVMLQDISVSSESVGGGDYSKTQNNEAYDQVLERLNLLSVDEEETVASAARAWKARVI